MEESIVLGQHLFRALHAALNLELLLLCLPCKCTNFEEGEDSAGEGGGEEKNPGCCSNANIQTVSVWYNQGSVDS